MRRDAGVQLRRRSAALAAPLLLALLALAGLRAAAAAAPQAAVTGVQCRLDAAGAIADLLYRTAPAAGPFTGGCGTADSVLAGGRTADLDFSSDPIVEVQYGKSNSSAPLEWVLFRTAKGAARVCGTRNATGAYRVSRRWDGAGRALSALPVTCAGRGAARRASGPRAPAFRGAAAGSAAGGPPDCCIALFNRLPSVAPSKAASKKAVDCCMGWLNKTYAGAPAAAAAAAANQTCPHDGPPGEWSPTVTQDQLPVTRPPNWDYRNLSTAIYHGVNFTEATFLSGAYITAQVVHKPVPGVTSEMVEWWFNGNVDGDMLLNGTVYPRYLVWHPRDHLSQTTIWPGPKPGNATGALWSIIEFMMAQDPNGYLRSSPDGSWANNFWVYTAIGVHQLDRNTLDMRVTIPYFNTVPFRLLHEWWDVVVDGKPALAARSTMFVGIQPPIDSLWSKVVNPFAFLIFGGHCPVQGAQAWVEHAVQETGNFQYFLPQLYQQQAIASPFGKK